MIPNDRDVKLTAPGQLSDQALTVLDVRCQFSKA